MLTQFCNVLNKITFLNLRVDDLQKSYAVFAATKLDSVARVVVAGSLSALSESNIISIIAIIGPETTASCACTSVGLIDNQHGFVFVSNLTDLANKGVREGPSILPVDGFQQDYSAVSVNCRSHLVQDLLIRLVGVKCWPLEAVVALLRVSKLGHGEALTVVSAGETNGQSLSLSVSESIEHCQFSSGPSA